MNNEILAPGTLVRVSDGAKQPPAHHTRKLEAWKDRNYTATVKEYQERPEPCYSLDRPEYQPSVCIAAWNFIVPARMVTAI